MTVVTDPGWWVDEADAQQGLQAHPGAGGPQITEWTDLRKHHWPIARSLPHNEVSAANTKTNPIAAGTMSAQPPLNTRRSVRLAMKKYISKTPRNIPKAINPDCGAV